LAGVTLGLPISIVDNPSQTSSPSGPVFFAKAASITPTTISTGSLTVTVTVSAEFRF
jgi:uncharacterized protein YggE